MSDRPMVVGKIIFNLDDSYARTEMERKLKSDEVFCLLSEIDRSLRERIKYNENITEQELSYLGELRCIIRETNLLDLYY